MAVAPCSRQPLVSVITPCLNAARFIEETVTSVLAQDYPCVEYLVMDGGSTDETLQILHKYRDRLRLESQPDRGTADALNRGFGMAKGEILAWLSADDTYFPGAVSEAVRSLAAHPDAGVVYGEGVWVDAEGKALRRYPTRAFDPGLLAAECFICQPAAFFRRECLHKAGGLDPSLQVSFDYELWMRMAKVCRFQHADRCLATSRLHQECKTLARRGLVYREAARILRMHYGYVPLPWVYGYACWLASGRNQTPFEPPARCFAGYAAALPLGLWYNRNSPGRFLREWWRRGEP